MREAIDRFILSLDDDKLARKKVLEQILIDEKIDEKVALYLEYMNNLRYEDALLLKKQLFKNPYYVEYKQLELYYVDMVKYLELNFYSLFVDKKGCSHAHN